MNRKQHESGAGRALTYFTDFADQTSDEDGIVIPEDLTALSAEDLAALSEEASEAFTALYGNGSGLSADDLAALESLTEGIEALQAESARREAEDAERAEAAAALAARVAPATDAADDADNDDEGDEDEGDADADVDEADADAGDSDEDSADDAESLAAGSAPVRREIRVPRSTSRRRTPRPAETSQRTMADVVRVAPEVPGFAAGQGVDWTGVGEAVEARLRNFNKNTYARAASEGRHLRQQFGALIIDKPFRDGLAVGDNDSLDDVMARAVDESTLPGGSLVASGGWCAPSETVYDLCEMESRDGLFSLPEVNIRRGGLRWTTGPDFAALFAAASSGFHYTEQQDIDGTDYPKPCFRVPCPEFTEERLAFDGLCITSGILQERGYPEAVARFVRGVLIAHDHIMSGKYIAELVAGSTDVNMPANQVGATAPILTAIELQVEHYREVNRLPRGTSLEAVFPFWVRGAIRADLMRRLGVDMISVPDSRIDGWFRERGVNPQFVYNWQGVSGTPASGFNAYPTSVDFLLYTAGTWVKGGSDIITLDTLYDSTLLGENDYTALFTEEGWMIMKRCHDSRVVSVPICPDGATHAGVDISCSGAA